MSTSTERIQRKRTHDRAYEAGYARKPSSEDLDVSAWCEGLWQSYADTGDLRPTPEERRPK